jgi:hypothetical protein
MREGRFTTHETIPGSFTVTVFTRKSETQADDSTQKIIQLVTTA